MKRIGITTKPEDERAVQLANDLAGWLVAQDCSPVISQSLPAIAGVEVQPLDRMADDVDLMVVLGGDGTLLHVARRFIDSRTPLLGINLGRLGFLTDTPVGSMFDVVADVLAGRMKTKSYACLHAEVWRDGERIDQGVAMNDVVMQRKDHPRMIGFEMSIREQFVFRLRADGLVLATPAGSTAYALSAGGPIVHPEIDAITVVPICPHTLSNRPIMVPGDDVLEMSLIDSPAPAALNLDGQMQTELYPGDRILVRKAGAVSLVYLPERHYFEVLRSKLKWADQLEVD